MPMSDEAALDETSCDVAERACPSFCPLRIGNSGGYGRGAEAAESEPLPRARPLWRGG
jgi:hypothetical protein